MYPYNILPQLELNQPIEKKFLHAQMPQKKNIRNQKIKKHKTSVHNNIDEKLLELIVEAIEDKNRCILYYTRLLKMSKFQEERDILNEIRVDEHKHEKLLNKIYYSMVGKNCKVSVKESNISNSLKKEYQKSILQELKGIEFYKQLYIGIKNPEIRDMLFDIIIDDQGHSIKLTYLNSLYK